MKLELNDKAFFNDLSRSETGRQLHAFLNKVIDEIYDSRSWKDGDSKESADHAARILREMVMDRIRPPQPGGHVLNQNI